MTALMVTPPDPEPELVMVPVLFADVVEIVIPAAMELLLLRIRLPVPVVPPDTVKSELPLALLLVTVVPPLATVMAVVLIVRAEVALFSVTVVTFAPIPPLKVTRPLLVPPLVMVPVLLTEAVLMVTVLVVPELSIVRFPVPVMPPLIVMAPVVPFLAIVRLLPPRAIAPLKVGASVVTLLPRVRVPTALVPKLTGLDTVNVPERRLAEPPAESPKVMALADGPAAPLTVVALLTPATNVPFLMLKPPANVLAPERVSAEVALF